MDILTDLLPVLEQSSADLVTYLREERYDDIVPEAEALAAEIATIHENMVVVDDESKTALTALSEKLGALARKVNGCDDEAMLAAFEEGFQALKARRDAGVVLQ